MVDRNANKESDENTKDSKDSKDSKVGETLKKLFSAGVSGALLSEELIRSYLADAKLPKDLMQLVLQGAQKSKEEIGQRVVKEISSLIQKVDIVEEASKFAENHRFKIQAEIEIERKESKK